MKILYSNRAKDAIITASNINNLYSSTDLYQQWLQKIVKFNGNTANIIFAFAQTQTVFCEALSIANTNAYFAEIKLTNAEGQVFYEGQSHLKNFINIFEVPDTQVITKAEITLTAANQIYCGYIYIGGALILPDFTPAPNYDSEITADGNRTLGGQAYGVQGEILKSWRFAFRQISNDKRRELERYIEAVQYIEPHIIKPYDIEVEPIYATLTKAGGLDKRKEGRLFLADKFGI